MRTGLPTGLRGMVLVVALGLLVPVTTAQAATIVDLGATTAFTPRALNDSDVVAGDSGTACEIWQSGTLTPVHTGNFCSVGGINNAGQVAGVGDTGAFVWQAPGPAQSTDGGKAIRSGGINEAGLSAFTECYPLNCGPQTNPVRGFAWSPPGSPQAFPGTVGPQNYWSLVVHGISNSGAVGVNNNGEILWPISGNSIGGGQPIDVDADLLRRPINNHNDVVGSNVNTSKNVLRMGASGAETDLGTLSPMAVNDSDQVVGSDGSDAALWTGGTKTDLNTLVSAGSGWVLQQALDINSAGDIVGTGTLNGSPHGFLLEFAGLRGAVTDAKGKGVPGAVIAVTGKDSQGNSVKTSVTTKADGRYSLAIAAGTYDLDPTAVTPPTQPKGGRWLATTCPGAAGANGTCHFQLLANQAGPIANFSYVLPDLQAEHVEITQGIQALNWDTATTVQVPNFGATAGGFYSGVPMVKDVPTVVRAYASVANDPHAEAQTNVTAQLHAYRSSTGALAEIAGSPISAAPRSLQVGLSLPAARMQATGAYIFTLPKAWTEQGPITLVADINPEVNGERPIHECLGCTGNNAYALSQIRFRSTQPVTIRPFQIVYKYPNAGGRGFTTVNGPDLSSQYQRARDLLPLAPNDLIVQPFPAAVLDISAQVQHIVHKFRAVYHYPLSKPNLTDCYKIPTCKNGIISAEFDGVRRTVNLGHSGHTYLAGFDPSPAAGSTWPTRGFTIVGPDAPPRPLTDQTHELLHLLLFSHASLACGGGTNGQIGVPWPPDQLGYIQGVGLDRRPNSGGPGVYKIIAPGVGQPQWYDLMSYCTGGNDGVAWLSTVNWTKFVQDDLVPGTAADRPAALASSAVLASSTAAGTSLAVDASITPGGQATVLGASGTTGAPTPSQASQFHLEATDSGGRVISNIGVVPQKITESTVMMLAANLPARGATAIELTAGGRVVATLRKPSPGPSVRLVIPRGGLKAARHKLTIRWRAKGARGATLTATLQYEISRAQGWQTLAAGLTGQSYSVPLALLNHATRIHVRVVVGDGFSDAAAASPLIRLPRR